MIMITKPVTAVRLRSLCTERPAPVVRAVDDNSNSKDKDSKPPRITSNVKKNLQFIKILKELRQQKLGISKPTTSYRKKKVKKEDLPIDGELYEDPATTLYYMNGGFQLAVPVLLVDGYNVCCYWAKLKKYVSRGRLEVARQKLVDELVVFSTIKGVKVVVVYDATMSGLPTHKETFACVDIVFSASSCADAWIEKEVLSLREDGCPKVWVATSDSCQQQVAHGAGAYVWSCKALISEVQKHNTRSCMAQGFQSFSSHLWYLILLFFPLFFVHLIRENAVKSFLAFRRMIVNGCSTYFF